MTKTLTVKLSDKVYELLLNTSAHVGQTPEQIISEWVEKRIEQTSQDPLLQLAGIFEAAVTDVSEQHDKYIGQALRNNNAC